MKKTILTLVVVAGAALAASANPYKLSNTATEAKFAAAKEVSTTVLTTKSAAQTLVAKMKTSKLAYQCFYCL